MRPLRSRSNRVLSVGAVAIAVTKALPAWADPTDHAREDAAPEVEPYAHLWVGVSGALDFVYLPTGVDACLLASNGQAANSPHYNCTTPTGADFPTPAEKANSPVAGHAGLVGPGIQPGDVRVMFAADYAATANLLVGLRLGYVLNAYPGEAAVSEGHALGPKLHAEVRGTYIFGRRPLAHLGFAPLIFLGGGVSEFDGHAQTSVTLDHIVGEQPVVAWLTEGPFFFTVGGGVRYQFSPRVAVMATGRFNGALSGNGFLPTYGPEITIQCGLF
jgi:hypothetical protein